MRKESTANIFQSILKSDENLFLFFPLVHLSLLSVCVWRGRGVGGIGVGVCTCTRLD